MNKYEVTAVTMIDHDVITIRRPCNTSDEADLLACKFARDGFLVSIVETNAFNNAFPTRSVAA